jgi:hypothetical protein
VYAWRTKFYVQSIPLTDSWRLKKINKSGTVMRQQQSRSTWLHTFFVVAKRRKKWKRRLVANLFVDLIKCENGNHPDQMKT